MIIWDTEFDPSPIPFFSNNIATEDNTDARAKEIWTELLRRARQINSLQNLRDMKIVRIHLRGTELTVFYRGKRPDVHTENLSHGAAQHVLGFAKVASLEFVHTEKQAERARAIFSERRFKAKVNPLPVIDEDE